MNAKCVYFLSSSSVSDILRSNKYLENYTRDAYVDARGSSCQVCVMLGQIGQTLEHVGADWTGIGTCWDRLDRHWNMLGQIGQALEHVGADWTDTGTWWGRLDRHWNMLGQIGQTLEHVDS